MIEQRDGLLWPTGDTIAYQTILNELSEIPSILGHCKGRRACIQAGGNAGLWPRVLANHFQSVYTFEPDRTLFHCLVNNVTAPNVMFFNSAVGKDRKMVGLNRMYWPANSGAQFIAEDGNIPTLRIDDLGIKDCDLIQLDIEGFELFALQGAEATIAASKPTIVVELRKNAQTYFGISDQYIRDHICSLGYRFAEKLGFDEVFVAT